MVDLYGKEIKVGQKVAFSVMFGRSGTSHWLSIGEVIEVRKTEKREYCKKNKINLIVIKYNQINKIDEILNNKLKL